MPTIWPADADFQLGDYVAKKGRAAWRGRIVGWYRTDLTALGYAIESHFEPGSVQIYPGTAIEPWTAHNAVDLDEVVHLAAWSDSWPAKAEELITDLARVLGRETPIEHIGSTAIKGLVGKPIIDLLVGAGTPDDTERFANLITQAGWDDLGEAGIAGRRHLRKRSGSSANVHIVGYGAQLWGDNLVFRDFLRAQPAACAAYANVKLEAIASGAERLLVYSQRKADLIAELLGQARRWRAQAGAADQDLDARTIKTNGA